MTAETRDQGDTIEVEAGSPPGGVVGSAGSESGSGPGSEPGSTGKTKRGAVGGNAGVRKGRGIAGWLVATAGIVLVVGGGAGWSEVRAELVDEHITVSGDAEHFAGKSVAGPLTAYSQADTIKGHVLKATDGKSFAELERNDPARETAMQGASVRSSLMLSVLSFGVSALAIANGIIALFIGAALLRRR